MNSNITINPRNPRTKIYPRIFQAQLSISQYIPRNPRIGRHPAKDILSQNFVLKKYIIFPENA